MHNIAAGFVPLSAECIGKLSRHDSCPVLLNVKHISSCLKFVCQSTLANSGIVRDKVIPTVTFL